MEVLHEIATVCKCSSGPRTFLLRKWSGVQIRVRPNLTRAANGLPQLQQLYASTISVSLAKSLHISA